MVESQLSTMTNREIRQLAGEVLNVVLTALGTAAGDRTGGCLRILVAHDPTLGLRGWYQIVEMFVGTQKERRDWHKYFLVSMEKAIRLIRRFRDFGEISSWESRSDNDRDQMYGGAFVVRALIPELGGEVYILVSFSGLPEIGDEALGLLLVQKLGWVAAIESFNVLLKSGNELGRDILRDAAA